MIRALKIAFVTRERGGNQQAQPQQRIQYSVTTKYGGRRYSVVYTIIITSMYTLSKNG